MRVYVLDRGEMLEPLAFSKLADAKAYVRNRYPFVELWTGSRCRLMGKRWREWYPYPGRNPSSAEKDCKITSIEVDKEVNDAD